MFKTIGLIIGGLLLVFLGYVATREGKFRYERSGLIQAPPEKIFPYLSDFKKGGQWSPYEQMDPNMKKTYTGTDGQVGAVMEFDGNKDAGSGKLEILNIIPNQSVDIKLTMIKPFHAENLIQYTLTPEAGETRFTWAMSGDGGFMGKLINVFIDCEAMVAGQFSVGIENLQKVVESQP